MSWSWPFVLEILPMLLEGVKITIVATLLGAAVAVILGLVLALLRQSRNRLLARATGLFCEFIRGTPLLVQLYFLFYILPDAGVRLPPLVAGVLGLGLHYATYAAEVYRAGIASVPLGQWEAARACNLTRAQTWRQIILPQAVPPIIPALANYFVAMFKETPLLSVVTILELMGQARTIANFSYRYLEPITLVGVFFLVISLISVAALRALERRFGRPV
ncbi:MAG: ectoine/hydroxyectoine ABC transporter permease subunit EhuD [Parvibaculaceae bacterium]